MTLREKEPKFSIVVPAWNRAAFLPALIGSVFSQYYQHLELIIVDDGSTDNTQEVISNFRDERLSYYKTENNERAAARNYGAARATGDYITFMDSDDILLPQHLQQAVEFLRVHNYPQVFHLNYAIADATGKVIRKSDVNPRIPVSLQLIRKGNVLSCMGVFLHRDLAGQFRFNEDRALSGSEDYELWLRIAARHEILHHPEVTSYLVQHRNRSVVNQKPERLILRRQLLEKYVFADGFTAGRFKAYNRQFRAGSQMYIALHLLMAGFRKSALQHFIKAVEAYPALLFSRRGMVVSGGLLGLRTPGSRRK